VTFVDPTPKGKVEVVVTPLSVQLGIGTPGGTILTSATSTGASAAYAYSFTVPLNIAAINTFLGTDTRKQTTLEFLATDSTGPNHYQTALVLRQQLLSTAVVDPSPPAVGISLETASGVFVPKEWPAGMVMVAVSQSGRRFAISVHDDGRFEFNEQ
jgi:hypothetical protein